MNSYQIRVVWPFEHALSWKRVQSPPSILTERTEERRPTFVQEEGMQAAAARYWWNQLLRMEYIPLSICLLRHYKDGRTAPNWKFYQVRGNNQWLYREWAQRIREIMRQPEAWPDDPTFLDEQKQRLWRHLYNDVHAEYPWQWPQAKGPENGEVSRFAMYQMFTTSGADWSHDKERWEQIALDLERFLRRLPAPQPWTVQPWRKQK